MEVTQNAVAQAVADAVRETARSRVSTKVRAVSAALFDARQPSVRAVARAHQLPDATLRALIGRVKGRLTQKFRP